MLIKMIYSNIYEVANKLHQCGSCDITSKWSTLFYISSISRIGHALLSHNHDDQLRRKGACDIVGFCNIRLIS